MENQFIKQVRGIAYSTQQHIDGVSDVTIEAEIKELRTTTQTVVTIDTNSTPSGFAALIRVLNRHGVFISRVSDNHVRISHHE